MRNPLFYAKILLFGEYGIIEDSKGLTIPYNTYKGSLNFSNDTNSRISNESIRKFAEYLAEKLKDEFDFEKLNADIANGMHFDSDIPQGYGVGSSGALVAAIYEAYAFNKIDTSKQISKDKISSLKEIFSKMESFFHGKSSGIDPLICYLNLPLLINSKTDISAIGIPEQKESGGAIFLVNSGSPGETAPMVQIFFEKLKQEGFRKTLKEEFIKYNNACVEAFVKGDLNPLFYNLKELSTWAFLNFKPMIPQRLLNIWQYGIQTNSYYLKLCGSGGGGYILGFTRDYEKARIHLKDFDTEVIYKF
ncbi:MAG: mevalonate kinase [Weeksellaceae bacterium]|nr:mevalonate kinase [Weeksellaceae bacterium]